MCDWRDVEGSGRKRMRRGGTHSEERTVTGREGGERMDGCMGGKKGGATFFHLLFFSFLFPHPPYWREKVRGRGEEKEKVRALSK